MSATVGSRWRRTAGLALAATALLAGCTGDGDGGAAGERGAAARPSPGADLAERLGCRSGSFATASGGGWHEVDVHDCRRRMTARIYGSLTSPQRAAAVRLLATEADGGEGDPEAGCASFGASPQDLYVVAGDTWVAVVRGAQNAASAAQRLDGVVQPGRIDTPSMSGVGDDCLPGP